MQKSFWIGGKHSVIAAIRNPKRKIYEIVSSNPNIKIIENLKVNYRPTNFIKKIFKDNDIIHQNICAKISPLPKINLTDSINHYSNILILDNVTDPRNFGSIIRTAAAFSVDAIIIKKKTINLYSPMLFKASSGSTEFIDIIEETNLGNAINILKKNLFWIFGSDSKTSEVLNSKIKNEFKKKVFIFGSEGKGISKNILKMCDKVFKIKINNNIQSLNVSNSVAAFLAILNSN